MFIDPIEHERRAREFANEYEIDIVDALGSGTDGSVWKTSGATAIKVFDSWKIYCQERDCYDRLAHHKVREINEFNVPLRIIKDDDSMIIEISIVQPPYILDFGKCRLDHKSDFPPEVLNERRRENEDIWGDKWVEVQLLLWKLEHDYGIYYADPNRGNIRFTDADGGYSASNKLS